MSQKKELSGGKPASEIALTASITNNFGVKNPDEIKKILKGAERKVYTQGTLPALKADQVWINGGQTRNWFEQLPTTGKQLFFVDSLGNITPWLVVSIQDVLKIQQIEQLKTALFNLTEQLKNNYSAAEMGKIMKNSDPQYTQYYTETYEIRKTHAQEMLSFIRKIISRKQKLISKNQDLFSEIFRRIEQYSDKMNQL